MTCGWMTRGEMCEKKVIATGNAETPRMSQHEMSVRASREKSFRRGCRRIGALVRNGVEEIGKHLSDD